MSHIILSPVACAFFFGAAFGLFMAVLGTFIFTAPTPDTELLVSVLWKQGALWFGFTKHPRTQVEGQS